MTGATRRNLLVHTSGVLEAQGCKVCHCTDKEVLHSVSKEVCSHTAANRLDMKGYAAEHAPKDWQTILAQKTWDSPNTDSEVQGAGAWSWILHWWSAHEGSGDGVEITHGWLASLLQFRSVYVDLATNVHYMALAPKKFAALMHPLAETDRPGHFTFADVDPLWVFVHSGNLQTFVRRPWELILDGTDPLYPFQLALGEEEPLVAEALRRTITISAARMKSLWTWYGLGDAPADGDYLGGRDVRPMLQKRRAGGDEPGGGSNIWAGEKAVSDGSRFQSFHI